MEREPLELVTASNGVQYLAFHGWDEQASKISLRLNVGMSARAGGCSEEPFRALNMALHVEDRDEDVIRNRHRLAEALGISADQWVSAEQVHGNEVAFVTHANCGAGFLSRGSALPAIDGLLTAECDIWLNSFYADCVPLYFFDAVKGIVGIAHAGWRGTAKQIARAMVERMVQRFGSQVSDIHALIGPAIGGCCYLVDEIVISELTNALGDEVADCAVPFPGERKQWSLDLKRANQFIMMKAGISASRIELSQWCTSCEPGMLYSHRRDRGKTGRMTAWIHVSQRKVR